VPRASRASRGLPCHAPKGRLVAGWIADRPPGVSGETSHTRTLTDAIGTRRVAPK
jgi:hypothetical protein